MLSDCKELLVNFDTEEWIAHREHLFPNQPTQCLPVTTSVYLDDMMFLCLSKQVADIILQIMIQLEKKYLFVLSWEKFAKEGFASQIKTFLGVVRDLATGSRSVEPEKVTFVLKQIASILSIKARVIPYRSWLSLVMRLNHMSPAVPFLRQHINFCFMQTKLKLRLKSGMVCITPDCIAELQWCNARLQATSRRLAPLHGRLFLVFYFAFCDAQI
jgi:hypothetical protein